MEITPELVTIITAIVGAITAIVVAIIQVRGQKEEKKKAEEKISKLAGQIQSRDSSEASLLPIKHLDRVKTSKILRAGAVKHPPLSEFSWEKGEMVFSGYYVQLCKQVCVNNNIIVQFFPVDWTDIPDKVFKELDLDLVLSVFETVKRCEGGDFTCCFHKVRLTGLTNLQNSRVQTIDDLYKEDVRIVVTKGEAGWEFVTRELKTPRHRLIVVENSNITEMMDYVLNDRVDVAICDEVSCQEYASKNHNVKHIFRDDEVYICKNCIMVPKHDNEFRDWVNEEFRKARNTPKLLEMENEILSDPLKLIRKYS